MVQSDLAAGAIDFSVCESERIDAPGAIQSFGAIFVLHRKTFALTNLSSNAAALIGETLESAIGKRPSALADALGLDIDLPSACKALRLRKGPSQPIEIAQTAEASYLLSLGLGHFLLERRPEPSEPSNIDIKSWNASLESALTDSAENVFALMQSFTGLVRSLTGFDRVMIYRFAPEASGEVVAEARAKDMTPYLGLHYPATDIPPQARRLYLDNRIREIFDTDAIAEPIFPRCGADSLAPVDLSTSILRAISPYHLQYTANMGVRATLVSSLIVDGKLWGLLTCHHRIRKLVPAAQRWAILAATDAVAEAIARIDAETTRRHTENSREALGIVEKALANGENRAHALLEAIIFGTGSDGGMLCKGSQVIAVGRTPLADILPIIGKKLADGARNGIIATNDLGAYLDAPDLALDGVTGAAGIVIADDPVLLVAFREEFVHSVNWGGDPRQAAEVDAESGKISPRTSFNQWSETIRGKSRPWDGDVTAFLAGLSEIQALPDMAGQLEIDMRSLRDNVSDRDALRASVMNVALDGMTLAIAADDDGTVRLVSGNRAFMKLFDLHPEECRSMPLTTLVGRLGIRESLESLAADTEIVMWSPTQGPRNIALQRRSVLDTLIDGARRNWDIYIFQDVTEMRRREEALTAAFEHALGEVRAKAEFLANMSHELRTPLNAVLGFSEIIAGSMFGEHSNPKYEEYGQNIQGAGSHLLELIDRLLTVSQIEARKRALDETVFDLVGLTEECATWVREQAGPPKPAIAVTKPAGAIFVFGDELALRQIAINLIGNAAKFTPPSGEVIVTVMLDDMGAPEMIVRDNGPGIDPALLSQLFQPFRQGESAYVRRHGGAGLGLSIVKGLTSLHGGTVRLNSNLGSGTEAIVLLPVARRR